MRRTGVLVILVLIGIIDISFAQNGQKKAKILFESIIDETKNNYDWDGMVFKIQNRYILKAKMHDEAYANIVKMRSKGDSVVKETNKNIRSLLKELKKQKNSIEVLLNYEAKGNDTHIKGISKESQIIDRTENPCDCMLCILSPFVLPKMDTDNTYTVKKGIIRIDKNRNIDDDLLSNENTYLNRKLSMIFRRIGFDGTYMMLDFMRKTNRYEYHFKQKSPELTLVSFQPLKDKARYTGYLIINKKDKAIKELHIGSLDNAELKYFSVGLLGYKTSLQNHDLDIVFEKVNETYVPSEIKVDKVLNVLKNKKRLKFIENTKDDPEKLVIKYNDARIKEIKNVYRFHLENKGTNKVSDKDS